MRITINEGIEGYRNVILEVPEWFFKRNILAHQATVIRETDKALLLEIRGEFKWIPKSLVKVHPIPKGLGLWQLQSPQ